MKNVNITSTVMDASTKVDGKVIRDTEKVYSNGQQLVEQSIQEASKTTVDMAKEKSNTRIKLRMMAIGSTTREVVKESSNGEIMQSTTETSLMTRCTAKENSHGQQIQHTKGIGR